LELYTYGFSSLSYLEKFSEVYYKRSR